MSMKVRVNMKARVKIKIMHFVAKTSSFKYFKNCHVCSEVKNKKRIVIGKCDAL